ncbi:methylated-DNA--[protein]-cysteine S-methyltransferase [Blastopirellula marina]|uniref:methylated-DNA--[protein]-cysteine S-methyltransferase n=1 Tax=Blastopirellula marina TaxID=124 RepID=A0A2S8GBW6_9BACT|nr:methylated-DNA--[protein]-cysteine S-methyltransferase [Blastopirellula marina]PQO41956.1 cysteine methyltransferase [Blastopirellula marina]PTL46313.1 methylated-DNA--[protein]-cysteine S-methyltransferase [Blastopirellula marina]
MNRHSAVIDLENQLTVRFETELGWAEIAWHGNQVSRFAWLPRRMPPDTSATSHAQIADLTQTQQELVQDIIDYAAGTPIDFSQVEVCFDQPTPFRRRIWEACQQIPYGELVTYGQLARLAGRPGAARAVGSAMSQNQIPIIIPCHRVIAAGNKIGGFTNPEGIGFKERLLKLEAAAPLPFTTPSKKQKSARRPK